MSFRGQERRSKRADAHLEERERKKPAAAAAVNIKNRLPLFSLSLSLSPFSRKKELRNRNPRSVARSTSKCTGAEPIPFVHRAECILSTCRSIFMRVCVCFSGSSIHTPRGRRGRHKKIIPNISRPASSFHTLRLLIQQLLLLLVMQVSG